MGILSGWLAGSDRDVIVIGTRADDLVDSGDELPELPDLDDDGSDGGPRLNWACMRCGVGGYAFTHGHAHGMARQHAAEVHPGRRMRVVEQ